MSERKTANGKAPIFIAMKKHRHINARNDEWVHIHRAPPSGGGGFDWIWRIALPVAGFFIAIEIIKAMAPYVILGLIGWGIMKAKIIK
jgi:hypothetical protein